MGTERAVVPVSDRVSYRIVSCRAVLCVGLLARLGQSKSQSKVSSAGEAAVSLAICPPKIRGDPVACTPLTETHTPALSVKRAACLGEG